VDARQITKSSGIADLFPGSTIDDFLFIPMGYSMNGLIDESYFTIHITPQPNCSYVSFETNIPHKDYSSLIRQILEIFHPGKFTLLFFANELSSEMYGHTVDSAFEHIEGFKRSEDIDINFETYQLSFCQYDKNENSNNINKNDVSKPNGIANNTVGMKVIEQSIKIDDEAQIQFDNLR